jgi:hypothetical protein
MFKNVSLNFVKYSSYRRTFQINALKQAMTTSFEIFAYYPFMILPAQSMLYDLNSWNVVIK